MDLWLMLAAPLGLGLLGFVEPPGALAHVVLEVPDIHCAGCEKNIEMLLGHHGLTLTEGDLEARAGGRGAVFGGYRWRMRVSSPLRRWRRRRAASSPR